MYFTVQWLVIALGLLLFLVLRLRGNSPPQGWQLQRVFRFRALVQLLGILLIFTAVVIPALTHITVHPDTFPPWALLPALLSLFLLIIGLRLRYDSVRLYDQGLAGVSRLGLRRYIGWDQVSTLNQSDSTFALGLTGPRHPPVYLPVDLAASGLLVQCLHEQLPETVARGHAAVLKRWVQGPQVAALHTVSQHRMLTMMPYVAVVFTLLTGLCLVMAPAVPLEVWRFMLAGVLLATPMASQAASQRAGFSLLQAPFTWNIIFVFQSALLAPGSAQENGGWGLGLCVCSLMLCGSLLVCLAQWHGARMTS